MYPTAHKWNVIFDKSQGQNIVEIYIGTCPHSVCQIRLCQISVYVKLIFISGLSPFYILLSSILVMSTSYISNVRLFQIKYWGPL